MITRAAARNLPARARLLAQQVMSWAAAGLAGDDLQRALECHGPADIAERPTGWTCRCYGIQTPPGRSPHAAILTWATMALEQGDTTMCKDDITRAIDTLKRLDATERADFMIGAALESGGHYHTPEPQNTWDSQRVEIKAHGIFAEGESDAEAIRNWQRAAEATLRERRMNAA